MHFDALRQETFAALAATAIENGATVFGLHASAETELMFTSAFGRLIGWFHYLGAGKKVVKRIAKVEEEWRVSREFQPGCVELHLIRNVDAEEEKPFLQHACRDVAEAKAGFAHGGL